MDVPGSTACTADSPVPVRLVKHILRSGHETTSTRVSYRGREGGGGGQWDFPPEI